MHDPDTIRANYPLLEELERELAGYIHKINTTNNEHLGGLQQRLKTSLKGAIDDGWTGATNEIKDAFNGYTQSLDRLKAAVANAKEHLRQTDLQSANLFHG